MRYILVDIPSASGMIAEAYMVYGSFDTAPDTPTIIEQAVTMALDPSMPTSVTDSINYEYQIDSVEYNESVRVLAKLQQTMTTIMHWAGVVAPRSIRFEKMIGYKVMFLIEVQ